MAKQVSDSQRLRFMDLAYNNSNLCYTMAEGWNSGVVIPKQWESKHISMDNSQH
jgi:hypothetical protein